MTNTAPLSVVLATLGLIQIAPAAVTYTYTGKNFTTASGIIAASDHVSVSFTLASKTDQPTPIEVTPTSNPSQVIFWAMSDGVAVVSSADGVSSFNATFLFDQDGNILNWNVQGGPPLTALGNQPVVHMISTCFVNTRTLCNGDSAAVWSSSPPLEIGSGQATPGTWTMNALAPTSQPVNQFFTHVADGGQGDTWQTDFLIVNTTRSAVTAALVFHLDSPAIALPISIPNLGTVPSIANLSIPPNGSVLIRTGGSPATPLVTGWAEVDSTGTVNGQAVFRRHALDGNYYEGAVPMIAPISSFTLPFDGTTYVDPVGSVVAPFVTGVALANPNADSTAVVTCNAYDQDANSLGINLQLGFLEGFQHTSFVLPEVVPALGTNHGVLVCSSTQPVGVVDLRFFGSYALTSMPTW